MDIEKFKCVLEDYFVDEYEVLKDLMIKINVVLCDDEHYQYNEFCLDIEKYLIEAIKENDIEVFTTNMISELIVMMVNNRSQIGDKN